MLGKVSTAVLRPILVLLEEHEERADELLVEGITVTVVPSFSVHAVAETIRSGFFVILVAFGHQEFRKAWAVRSRTGCAILSSWRPKWGLQLEEIGGRDEPWWFIPANVVPTGLSQWTRAAAILSSQEQDLVIRGIREKRFELIQFLKDLFAE